jgi:PAS domain-containing protein
MSAIFSQILPGIPNVLIVFLSLKFLVLGFIIYRSLKRNKKIKHIVSSESRFRSVFHHAPYAMVLTDGKNTILHANSEFVKLTGFHSDQSSLLDYIPVKQHFRYLICSLPLQKTKFRHPVKTPTGMYLNCFIQTSLLEENHKLITFSPEHFSKPTIDRPCPATVRETGKRLSDL